MIHKFVQEELKHSKALLKAFVAEGKVPAVAGAIGHIGKHVADNAGSQLVGILFPLAAGTPGLPGGSAVELMTMGVPGFMVPSPGGAAHERVVFILDQIIAIAL